jgi:hypothetical protein
MLWVQSPDILVSERGNYLPSTRLIVEYTQGFGSCTNLPRLNLIYDENICYIRSSQYRYYLASEDRPPNFEV